MASRTAQDDLVVDGPAVDVEQTSGRRTGSVGACPRGDDQPVDADALAVRSNDCSSLLSTEWGENISERSIILR